MLKYLFPIFALTIGSSFGQAYNHSNSYPGCNSYTYTPGCYGEAHFSNDKAYVGCEIRFGSSVMTFDPSHLTQLGCETYCRALVQNVEVIDCGEEGRRREFPIQQERESLVNEADRPA